MKYLFLTAFLFLSISGVKAQTLSDEALLATDPTFQSRVHAAMLQYAVTISSEGAGVSMHPQRDAIAVQVLTDTTGQWVQRFASAVAAQPSIAASADANGGTALTPNVCSGTPQTCTGNLSTQAALVPDSAIISAITNGWNVFIGH